MYASTLNDISRLSFWKTERFSRMHSIFQLILLTKLQFFFGFIWLLHCSWFFFSCKPFLLGINKISCIHGSFLLLLTLPELWNFHAWLEECVRSLSSFSFSSIWYALESSRFAYRLAFGLDIFPSKNAFALLARTHEHWYQVCLHYRLQLNVDGIHPLIVVAAVIHAHVDKLLLTALA